MKVLIMKKLLLFIPLLLLVTSCGKAPKEELEPVPPGTTVTAVLTANKTSLTASDTEEPFTVSIATNENENAKYDVELSAGTYLNTKSQVANQIGLKPGASIKSVSNALVYRLVIDFYGTKGINFDVIGIDGETEEAIEPHETSINPVDPSDGGRVLEYPLVGYVGWQIKNNTEFNKPSFYSVTIIYS